MLFRSILFCIFCVLLQAESSKDTSKDAILDSLLLDLVDDSYAQNLSKTLYLQIHSGLMLANRAIFDELLEDAAGFERKKLIDDYDRIEKEMSTKFEKIFFEKIDMKQMLFKVNREIYKKYFTVDELLTLQKFFKTPAGKKFVSLGKEMIEETQKHTAELLYPLSRKLAGEMQKEIEQRVKKLFEIAADQP